MLEEGYVLGGEEAAHSLSKAVLGSLSDKQCIQSDGSTGCGTNTLKNKKKHIWEKSACKEPFQDAISE